MGRLFDQIYDYASDQCDPTQVKIDLNYSCNLDCIHCYVDHGIGESISVEQFRRIFDQLVEMNTLRLVFTGGEPLLRKDFVDIVREAAARGFIIEILTNATRIDRDMAVFFKRHRVRKVQVSLHGSTPQMHDEITRVPGSFEKAVQGIRHLRQAGIGVSIACNLLKSNFRYWREIKSFVEQELGISIEMSYWLVQTPANVLRLQQCALTVEQVVTYLSELYQTVDFSTPAVSCAEDLKARICLAGVNNCRILPNGDVIPCSRIEAPMGNILETDFATLWRESSIGRQLRKLRRKDLLQCAQCEDYTICPMCPGFSFQKTEGFVSAVDEVCKYVHADGDVRRALQTTL